MKNTILKVELHPERATATKHEPGPKKAVIKKKY
jgi:hypothetical protein